MANMGSKQAFSAKVKGVAFQMLSVAARRPLFSPLQVENNKDKVPKVCLQVQYLFKAFKFEKCRDKVVETS